jgi:hypothetical protein
MQITFWPTAYDGTRGVLNYKPSQYVEIEYERVKASFHGQPALGYHENVKLFGNKAVRYTIAGLGGTTIILCYLGAPQLSGRAAKDADEYQVRVTTDEFDKESLRFFDAVLNSFWTIK